MIFVFYNQCMIYGIRMEICAGSLNDVKTAASFPETDRIELNSHLEEDGLTPSPDVLMQAKEITSLPILCMVRPHNHGFVYNDDEKEQMKQEAQVLLQAGADGIVCGGLKEDHTLDESFMKEMISLAHTCNAVFVFHRAFDEIEDPEEAIRTLAAMKCERILTSGGKGNASDHLDTLRLLNEEFGDRIEVQPAGGINASNIQELLNTTGITRFHMSLHNENGTGEEKIRETIEAIRNRRSPTHKHHHLHPHILTGEDQAMFDADSYEASMDNSEDDHDR
jgi:copper homeostasis protein